jgi:hypothetical protein
MHLDYGVVAVNSTSTRPPEIPTVFGGPIGARVAQSVSQIS